MPKVSIILTSFNHAKYLRDAIDSALNQSFEDFEVIIWDDLSTDNSWEIICSYNDSRIIARRNSQNFGGGNINRAIEIAKGEYIAIHHSDDIWELDKLAKQVAYLDSHVGIGAVFTNVLPIDEDGQPFADKNHFYFKIFDQENRSRFDWLRHFFINGNALCHPSVLIRKSCYGDCGLYRVGFAQLGDFDMWIRLTLKYEIHVLREKLLRFRIRDNEANSSGNRPEALTRHYFEYWLIIENYLKLGNLEDIFRIFPEGRKYCCDKSFSVRYILAMAILEIKPSNFSVLFALRILFELLNDPGENEFLGIDRKEFARLVAELDPFQVVRFERLNKAVAERDSQIANLRQEVAERNETVAAIVSSLSWRITRPLRFFARGLRKVRQTIPDLMREFLFGKRLGCFTKNVYVAVCEEVRRHGISGFFSRLPYYLSRSRTYMALLASRPPATDGGLFSASAPVPRDIRLHPELSGIKAPIDMSVSVVIPTLNAGLEFRLLLRKLRAQRGFRKLEIVVVDSGSQDATVEVAREAGCKVVEIPSKDFSHSYARNTGADAASGDYLLFMVQDAYPIGDYWIFGILRYLLDHSDKKLVAASCAEYSRSDSDMMYDSMINTHYRFLGCIDYDRIGEYKGDDHMSLRSYGQLSDVACLIARETFARYRYRGDYAEDLDLGIRLIKDGFRVAMLASIKVVHSHNRPAYYYLKRSFVDVFFLVNIFEDFTYPRVESPRGLIVGIVSIASHLSDWFLKLNGNNSERILQEEIEDWIRDWRRRFVQPYLGKLSQLGDPRLDAYIDSLARHYLPPTPEPLNKAAQNEMRHFLDTFLARIEHFGNFAAGVYGAQDTLLRVGLRDAVLKIFGATAGSALGFMYLSLSKTHGVDREMAEAIGNELKAGV